MDLQKAYNRNGKRNIWIFPSFGRSSCNRRISAASNVASRRVVSCFVESVARTSTGLPAKMTRAKLNQSRRIFLGDNTALYGRHRHNASFRVRLRHASARARLIYARRSSRRPIVARSTRDTAVAAAAAGSVYIPRICFSHSVRYQ